MYTKSATRLKPVDQRLGNVGVAASSRGGFLRNGIKIIDMDTHVNPNFEVLAKYVEPAFRQRLDEFKPYLRNRQDPTGTVSTITVSPYPFERFPGQAPAG